MSICCSLSDSVADDVRLLTHMHKYLCYFQIAKKNDIDDNVDGLNKEVQRSCSGRSCFFNAVMQ